jgi:hypothetical protein
MSCNNSKCRKEYQSKYREENEVKLKEYRAQNKQKIKERDAKRVQDLKQHAIECICSEKIIDMYKWELWCNRIKTRDPKHPYSEDFTSNVIWGMMTKGCFYCGDIATGIDRIDSTLDHTQENCVASCWGCNNSKGVSDSSTFIRKAYYRSRKKYFDDDIVIWFVNATKPTMYKYKNKDKKVPFDLSKEDFECLIHGDCKYCLRSPTTWFGIDRVVPSLGYVIGNVVSCCWDCNRDKHDENDEKTVRRNERIADRVDSGELVIDDFEKVILHNGTQKSSKRICAYGKVYESKIVASRALGKGTNYVCNCIRDGRYPDDIFEIDDESV